MDKDQAHALIERYFRDTFAYDIGRFDSDSDPQTSEKFDGHEYLLMYNGLEAVDRDLSNGLRSFSPSVDDGDGDDNVTAFHVINRTGVSILLDCRVRLPSYCDDNCDATADVNAYVYFGQKSSDWLEEKMQELLDLSVRDAIDSIVRTLVRKITRSTNRTTVDACKLISREVKLIAAASSVAPVKPILAVPGKL